MKAVTLLIHSIITLCLCACAPKLTPEEELAKALGDGFAGIISEIREELIKEIRREIAIAYATALYYQEYDRWPNDLADFPSRIKRAIRPVKFSDYDDVNFTETENGDVMITYVISDDQNANIREARISKEEALNVNDEYIDFPDKLNDMFTGKLEPGEFEGIWSRMLNPNQVNKE